VRSDRYGKRAVVGGCRAEHVGRRFTDIAVRHYCSWHVVLVGPEPRLRGHCYRCPDGLAAGAGRPIAAARFQTLGRFASSCPFGWFVASVRQQISRSLYGRKRRPRCRSRQPTGAAASSVLAVARRSLNEPRGRNFGAFCHAKPPSNDPSRRTLDHPTPNGISTPAARIASGNRDSAISAPATRASNPFQHLDHREPCSQACGASPYPQALIGRRRRSPILCPGPIRAPMRASPAGGGDITGCSRSRRTLAGRRARTLR